MAAGTRSRAPSRAICQTRTARLCRGTHKASVTCHLEYRLKEERHGAFRRLKARPCESLRLITPDSVAVRCVASAGAATSAEPPGGVAVSGGDMASGGGGGGTAVGVGGM